LASGNGVNRMLKIYDQNGGEPWVFPNSNNAPSLFTEPDLTKSLETTTLVGSSNGVHLSGNTINAVYSATNTGYILIPAFNNNSTLLYFSLANNYGSSSAKVGAPRLFDGLQQITNTYNDLHEATVGQDYKSINYRDVAFPSELTFRLCRFANGQGRNLVGRIKEISTCSASSSVEENLFISDAMHRNSIV